MKTLKNPLLLILVWILSLLALSVSFILYSKEGLTFQKITGGTFLLMIYSAIFSLPAFIFFFLVSFFVLRSAKLSSIKKRLIMCSANLVDIVLTFGALYFLMAAETGSNESARQLKAIKDIFSFYPIWVLVIVSNTIIFLLPFNFNKPIKH